jgi:Ricin-type beta-trefoil lectin domain-like
MNHIAKKENMTMTKIFPNRLRRRATLASLMASVILVAAGLLTASPAAAAVTPYLFINNASHLCMDVTGGSTADNARVQQWYCYDSPIQRWSMVYVKAVGATLYYELVNQNSKRCLDVPGGSRAAGVELQQWGCWGGDMQLWAVETQSSIQSPVATSRLRNLMTGMCVDDKDWSNTRGTSLQQWDCNDLPPQQWYIP